MNTIRLLKLYKQHYLDRYEKEKMAVEDYSCWGYFDCMTVEKVENRGDIGLFSTKGNVNMTDLWYSTARNIEKFNGYYGQQNIGIFRHETKEEEVKDEEFWAKGKEAIILCSCMVQVDEAHMVKESIAQIEQFIKDEKQRNDVQGIVYRTFDNADLIVFFKGNSYAAIAEMINKLGKIGGVIYTYSVCGIAQKYLDEIDKMSDAAQIGDVKYNDKTLVNDKIAEIRLELVGSGKIEWSTLQIGQEKSIEKADALGYMDNMLRIVDTDMWKVAKLLRFGNDGITHTNDKFGNGIYNISTVILPKWEVQVLRTEKRQTSVGSVSQSGWCISKIEELKLCRDKFEDNRNEILYSNWLALIQILNVLSQYENSMFSKDIFRIVFPSMNLICIQYNKILNRVTDQGLEIDDYEEILKIEKYIDEVDRNIHHLVHTSQNFLTIPGYCGSLYDIPTKLLLFYLAFAKTLIRACDDEQKEFECYISLFLNSKPEVREIEIECGEKEGVLKMSFAQRHLYMPRAFLVILEHEIFHYVGNSTRCREERASQVLKMCMYANVYRLFEACDVSGETEEELRKLKKAKEAELQCFTTKELSLIVKDRLEKIEIEKEEKYFAKNIEPMLVDSCVEFFGEPEYNFDKTLRELNPEEWGRSYDERIKLLKKWNDILCHMEYNKIALLDKNMQEKIVSRLMLSLQEIYSDLAIMISLDLDLEYYFETIPISEGMMLTDALCTDFLINRLAVVIYSLSALKNRKWEGQWRKLKKTASARKLQKILICKVSDYIKEMTRKNKAHIAWQSYEEEERFEMRWEKDIFWQDGIWSEQLAYADVCIKKLLIQFDNTKEEIKEIRAMFDLFKMYDKGKDKPYEELFDVYERMIGKYNQEVDEMVKKAMEEMQK